MFGWETAKTIGVLEYVHHIHYQLGVMLKRALWEIHKRSGRSHNSPIVVSADFVRAMFAFAAASPDAANAAIAAKGAGLNCPGPNESDFENGMVKLFVGPNALHLTKLVDGSVNAMRCQLVGTLLCNLPLL